MSPEQARQEALRRNGELQPGSKHRWFAKAGAGGDWKLIKVVGLAGMTAGPLKTVTEAKPRPPQPDDPRSALDRNIGGPWVG